MLKIILSLPRPVLQGGVGNAPSQRGHRKKRETSLARTGRGLGQGVARTGRGLGEGVARTRRVVTAP